MSQIIYRYELDAAIAMQDIEATLVLAIVAAESLHGETAAHLGIAHYLDTQKRVCVIDATERIGRDVNALFAGFLRREFGHGAFQARRVVSSDSVATQVAA